MKTRNQKEKRHFSRVPFVADVQLHFVLPHAIYKASLHDISLKGALIEFSQPVEQFDRKACRLFLELSEGGERIVMEGLVVHHEGRNVGIRCQYIDMDSMINLRRLVELNLGDEALLGREMAEMMEERIDFS